MIDAANIAALFAATPGNDSATRISAVGKPGSMSTEQIDKVAQDFESMFIGQMMEPMFGESTGEDAFGDSETKDIYRGLMMDEYGKQVSRAGGIGIADYVRQELLKLQEAAPSAGIGITPLPQ